MRLVFAGPAARELDDIIDQIALDNRRAAEAPAQELIE